MSIFEYACRSKISKTAAYVQEREYGRFRLEHIYESGASRLRGLRSGKSAV